MAHVLKFFRDELSRYWRGAGSVIAGGGYALQVESTAKVLVEHAVKSSKTAEQCVQDGAAPGRYLRQKR